MRISTPFLGFLAASLFLAAAGLLVALNHQTRQELQRADLARFTAEAEHRASGLSYFFSERLNDLSDLARAPAVENFFVNRALGMSMEYGLRASLLAIQDHFHQLQLRKTLGNKAIYQRIALLDTDGSLLVDTTRGTEDPMDGEIPVDPETRLPRLSLGPVADRLVVSAPYLFKGQYSAQVVAWMDLALLPGLNGDTVAGPVEQRDYVISAAGRIVFPEGQGETIWPVHELAALPPGVPVSVAGTGRDHGLALRIPIRQTDLFLLSVYPVGEVLRPATPLSYLVATAALPTVLLVAVVLLQRSRRSHEKLRVRYLETRRRRGELAERYDALAEEVRRRKAVEQTLREKQALLQERTTALQRAMADTHALAYYDHLTGLGNRILFKDCLRRALAVADRRGRQVALLFLDVDQFKRINDTLGHPAGDELLKQVATRLRACIREGDLISRDPEEECDPCLARQGGDEFTVLLTDVETVDGAAKVAQRLLDAMAAPMHIETHEVVVTASIGMSLYPDDGRDPDTLIKNADAAMYIAKDRGRNRFQFYEQSMHALAASRLSLEAEMRRALTQGQFELHYQPQVDLLTSVAVGVEALVRWHHPERGLVSPAEFIPVAEQSGLIIPITEWVVRSACEQAARWRREGLEGIRVAVNVSGRSMEADHLVSMVAQALEASGAPPQCLEVELTESILMERTRGVQSVLGRLKDLGVRIAIDDFGTGYSSLAYLKSFPIDSLKVDRSFVRDLPRDANSAAITRTIIAMARSMALEVVAEGVESDDQLAFLAQYGCTLAQGYLFARPAPAAAITPLLRAPFSGTLLDLRRPQSRPVTRTAVGDTFSPAAPRAPGTKAWRQ